MPRQVPSPKPPNNPLRQVRFPDRSGYGSLTPQLGGSTGDVVAPEIGGYRVRHPRNRQNRRTVRGGVAMHRTPYDDSFNPVNEAMTAPEGSFAMPRWISPEPDPNYQAMGMRGSNRGFPRRVPRPEPLVVNEMRRQNQLGDLGTIFPVSGGRRNFMDLLNNVRGMTRQMRNQPFNGR